MCSSFNTGENSPEKRQGYYNQCLPRNQSFIKKSELEWAE